MSRAADQLDDELSRRLGGAGDAAARVADETEALAQVAAAIRQHARRAAPSDERRARALGQLRSAVATERRRLSTGQRERWWRSPLRLEGRGVALAASAAAIVLLGGLVLGISFRGGDVSEAVQGIFSSDASDAKAAGLVTEVRPGGIMLQTGEGSVSVIIDGNTLVTGKDGEGAGPGDLEPGQRVDVKGTRGADGTIVASRVKIEEGPAGGNDVP